MNENSNVNYYDRPPENRSRSKKRKDRPYERLEGRKRLQKLRNASDKQKNDVRNAYEQKKLKWPLFNQKSGHLKKMWWSSLGRGSVRTLLACAAQLLRTFLVSN